MASKRTSKPTELTKVGGDAPAWLTGAAQGDKSLEGLKEYRILPRLKVIQAMTDQDLKNEFGEGSVILSPGNVPIMTKDETIDFVPVFFFTEFLKVADRDDTNSPMILARSYDKAGEIAARARSADKRFETYGEKGEFQARFVEVLNFPGFIVNEEHDQKGTPITLTFSRGEFGKGRAFINAITLRKVQGSQVPLWAQRWTLQPGFRERGSKKWWGIDFSNPDMPENLYIKENELPFFKSMAEEMKDLFEKARLLVDMSDAKDVKADNDEM